MQAPAKINWTLEVLGKRADGYHEVRSIMQTIGLADTITLRGADEITLSIAGDGGALAGEPVERNLAYRAALLLRGEAKRGVHIELEKRIPIAAGLGGGSSDAAAVLRGLRRLWAITISDEELAAIAAELGSDVPFFLRGGTALASGRGEKVESLPDVREQSILIAWPRPPSPLAPLPLAGGGDPAQETFGNKTARMYGALPPGRYSDGSRTERLAERLRRGEAVRDEDVDNVFEQLVGDVDPKAAAHFEEARAFATPHLCGSGPAFFVLAASDEHAAALADGLGGMGLDVRPTKTIASPEALSITKLS